MAYMEKKPSLVIIPSFKADNINHGWQKVGSADGQHRTILDRLIIGTSWNLGKEEKEKGTWVEEKQSNNNGSINIINH